MRVLRLEGTIGQRGSQGIRYATAERAIRRAFADSRWREADSQGKDKKRRLTMWGLPSRPDAVALVINSPGGSAVQSNLIYEAIREAKARTGVPVTAFVEDAAASGGYYLASAADDILVDPSSVVGSIGVIWGSLGFDKALERLSLESRLSTAGERKALQYPFSPDTNTAKATREVLLSHIHGEFKRAVLASRGARLGAVFRASSEALADARARADGAPSEQLAKVDVGDGSKALVLPTADGSFTPEIMARDHAPRFESVDDLMQGDIFVGAAAIHFGLADGFGRMEDTMAERMVEAGLATSPLDVHFDRVRMRTFGEIWGGADASTLGNRLASGALEAMEGRARGDIRA